MSELNYYEVLGCDKSCSFEDLKKSYQRLVLLYHPDKLGNQEVNTTFLLIQKAWNVLKEQQSRRQYDAVEATKEYNNSLIYEDISINDMIFDSAEKHYKYQCRCGGIYFLDCEDCDKSRTIIDCDECSLSLLVNTSRGESQD